MKQRAMQLVLRGSRKDYERSVKEGGAPIEVSIEPGDQNNYAKAPQTYGAELDRQFEAAGIIESGPETKESIEPETFNKSELEVLIAEAAGNPCVLAATAANLGGKAGEYVLNVLLKKCCIKDSDCARYALQVFTDTQDPYLKKYALKIRLEKLPQSMAQWEQTARAK
jgi:hypothetical protein